MKSNTRLVTLLLSLVLGAGALLPLQPAQADPAIPPVWDIVTERFEEDSLAAWNKVSETRLALTPGGGLGGSTGLSVSVGKEPAYLYQTGVAKATEGYLTFWFNPNNVSIPDPFTYWPPENALCVASIVSSVSDWWPPMVSLYVRRPDG